MHQSVSFRNITLGIVMFESGQNSTLPQAYCTLLPFPTLTDNIYKSSSCGFSIFGLEQIDLAMLPLVVA